jgi:rhodanese-related sulfurtransferase
MKKIIFILFTIMTSLIVSAQDGSFQSVNNDEFSKIIKKKRVQIIDVRTLQKYNTGHLPKAINLDIRQADFQEKAGKELKTKYPVAVYCRSGRRSKIAAQKLVTQGFEVYELNTGIAQWKGDIEK